MRSHGWGGNTPATDEEAIERILEAADKIIGESGSSMRIADVARALGVTRQTVYRYFPGTPGIVGGDSAALGRRISRPSHRPSGRGDRSGRRGNGSFAFAVEQLASDNQVELVLNQRHHGAKTVSIVSDTALAFGRSMLHRFDIDWEQHGFDEAGLDELNEFCLRVLHSFLADAGRPPRSGDDLRRFLIRWIGPAIAYPQIVRAMDALRSPENPRARRRPSAAS